MTAPLPRRLGGLAAEHHRAGTTSPDDPVVVVVPGAMDRAGGFRRTVRHLPASEVVVIDRRGYAGSIDVPVAADLAVHAGDLARVCAELERPIVVVGHSQGGLIALVAAAHALVDRLVGLVVWEPPMPWFDWYHGSSLAAGMGSDPAAAAEFFMRSMIGDRLWERLPPSTRTARLAEGPALLADLAASRRPDVAPDLGRVAVPTVVGRGSESRPHHRRSAEVVAAGVPAARLVEVDGAGHGVHLSHPAAFAALVEEHVERVGHGASAR